MSVDICGSNLVRRRSDGDICSIHTTKYVREAVNLFNITDLLPEGLK